MADLGKQFLDTDGLNALWTKHKKVQPFYQELGTSGTSGWVNFLTVKATTYMNHPLVVRLLCRGYSDSTMDVQFVSANNTTPAIQYFKQRIQPYSGTQDIPKPGYTYEDVDGVRYYKFWLKKNEASGSIGVHVESEYFYTTGAEDTGILTFPNVQSNTEPSGIVYVKDADIVYEAVPAKTAVSAAAVKVGTNAIGQVVLGNALAPSDLGISATTTSVTVGSTTANIPQATTTTPKMDGTAAVGTETKWAKGDHVHPTDTSRASALHAHGSITNDGKIGTTANLPVITGTVGAVTTGSFSTTASAVGTSSAAGTANTFSRGDHVHSISLATGDSDGQVKIAGSNVSVAGWGNKASQFSLGSTANSRVYTMFARMSDSNPDINTEAQVILSSAANYASTNQGTWEIIVSNRGSTVSSPKAYMTVRCINAVKAMPGTVTEPTFGYYIDATNHYIYFGIYSPRYRGQSRITVLVNNRVTLQDFGDSTTAPTGWTTVTPTGVSSAVKLDTARTIQTDLASTSSASFDGTANITPGVTGTLPVANGGTGATTPAGAQFNLIDKATTELGPMEDKHRIAIMSPEPSATNSVIAGYRTGLTMWNYMKGKMSSDTGVNISGNAATATSAGKLSTGRELAVGLSNTSTTTTFDGSANVTNIKVSGQLPVANGGTGSNTAAGARTNLSVYSKSEIDSLMSGRVEIVTELPDTGKSGVTYYVGPTGSGADKYDEYIWTGSAFLKVGEHSLDLSNYVNTVATSGSGTVVTGVSKSGNTVTVTKGNISLDDLSDWATETDVTISNVTYHTMWPVAPTSSNQVYGISINNGRLFRIYNNKGAYSVQAYDKDSDTTYTPQKLGIGYGTCTTAEATAAKVATLADYTLVKNGIVAVKFSYPLCASATLNINGKGAKPVYVGGAAVTATNCKSVQAGDIGYFIYDGTAYHFLGTDRAGKSSITGLSVNGRKVTYTRADGETGSFDTQDTTYSFADGYNASTNKGATVATVTNAINALDVTDISGLGAGKTLATLKEENGKISATFQNISITKSQVSDFSHTHGNIQNGGTLQTNDITIASGDKLVVTDSSDASKVARASIAFDGSTTTQALTKAGTWVTFNNYSLPLAASGTRGGIQIGYSESGTNYAVKLSSEKAYVTVPWTDTKVTQTKDDSGTTAYPLLMAGAADPNGTATTARYDSGVKLTPSTNTISANISGNAATATSAQSGSALETAINEKANKVDNATSGHFVGLDANGNLTDSGHKHEDYALLNCTYGTRGYITGAGSNPDLLLEKLKLGVIQLYQGTGVGVKLYEYDVGDEANAVLVWDSSTLTGGALQKFLNGQSLGTIYTSTAGKCIKAEYNGHTAGGYYYCRAFGIFMTPKQADTSHTATAVCRINGVTYGSYKINTYGGLVTAVCPDVNYTTVIVNFTPSATTTRMRFYGFRCLNTYDGENAVLLGRATSALSATKATQDSDGHAINATYFKSSGNVTLVSGTATKIGTQNGTDVKLTLPTIPAAANNGALQLQLNGGTASSKFTANQSGNSTLAFSTGSTAGTFKVDSTEIAIAGFTKVESSSTNGNIKINGTETAVYTHPTTAGNKHIPSGGSSGQFLGYDSAGTAKWVSNPNTDTKQRIVASDSKTYLTGVTTAPTSSNQDLTGVANANVYATAGQLHATTFDVNSKCTLQFNTTTNALDFVFA